MYDQDLSNTIEINVFEVNVNGRVSRLRLTVNQLVHYFAFTPNPDSTFKRAVSCFRDLMVFLRHIQLPASQVTPGGGVSATMLPAILPRTGFFLVDFFQLKLACWSDRCLVLDYSQVILNENLGQKGSKVGAISSAIFVENFIRVLSKSLTRQACQVEEMEPLAGGHFEAQRFHRDVIKECSRTVAMQGEHTDDVIAFEMIVLDSALSAVAAKFVRQVSQIKPLFNRLIDLVVAKPSDRTLDKLLAFKKSLFALETRVVSMVKAIENLLENDLDMAGLYLTEEREVEDHEEVELLLEGYRSDFLEVSLELRSMRNQIDDTKEFVNTHQSEARNRIIHINLYLEIATLGVTFVAGISSIFGMNLKSGIENDTCAFYVISFLISTFSILLVLICLRKFSVIIHSQKRVDYSLLKDIFRYADTLELLKESHIPQTSKADLCSLIETLTGKGIQVDELDLLLVTLNEENR